MLTRVLSVVLVVSIALALGVNVWANNVQTKRNATALISATPVAITPMVDTAPATTAAQTTNVAALNHAIVAEFERSMRTRQASEQGPRAIEHGIPCDGATSRVSYPQPEVEINNNVISSHADEPVIATRLPKRDFIKVAYDTGAPAIADAPPVLSNMAPAEAPMMTAHTACGNTVSVTPSGVIRSSAHGQTAWLVDTMAPIESASVSAQDGQVTVGYAGGATRTFDDSGEELGGAI